MEEGNWQRRLEARASVKDPPDEEQTKSPAGDLGHSGPAGNRCRELWSRVGPGRGGSRGRLYQVGPQVPSSVTHRARMMALNLGGPRQSEGGGEVQDCNPNTSQWASGSRLLHPIPRQAVIGFSRVVELPKRDRSLKTSKRSLKTIWWFPV